MKENAKENPPNPKIQISGVKQKTERSIYNFFSGFGDEYLRESEDGDSNRDKSLFQGYKSVLGTKSNEESLVGTTSPVLSSNL